MAFEVIYTNKGLEKLILAESGTPLIFEKFAVGDGENSPQPEQEQLQNEKWRGAINTVEPSLNNPQNLLISCLMPADAEVSEAFYIKELGLFDIAGDLIALAQVPDSYYAPSTDDLGSEKLYNLTLAVSNEATITLELDSTIYATQLSVVNLNNKVDTLSAGFSANLATANTRIDTTNSNLTKTNADVTATNTRIDTTNSNLTKTNSDLAAANKRIDDTNANLTTTNSKVTSVDGLFHAYLKSQIGQVIMNLHPSHRHATRWGDSTFIYLLCNGQAIDGTEFPDLKAFYGANVPNFKDGTIRHLATGSTRVLGDFQDDALQKITGVTSTVLDYDGKYTTGAFYMTGSGGELFDHGKGGGTGYWRQLNFDSSKVVKSSDETRMRNIAVQFYVKAKVLV